MTTAIFIPTLKRPQRIAAIISNLRETTEDPYELYFILEKWDQASISECERLKANYILNSGKGTYASCINTAFRRTSESFFFCGADDILFHLHWLHHARSKMVDPIRVVGTNDLWNNFVLAGIHATHFLVDRSYILSLGGVIDWSGIVLNEGYDHNYCDTEFIGTARFRGVFAPCLESVVEHLHANKVHDEVVDKTLANAMADARLFHSRKHLWNEQYPF